MAKRFLYYLSPRVWVNSLAVYSNGRLWQDVKRQAVRSRWAEVAAAIAFLWLLGLLGLSVVLLDLNQRQPLPLGVLAPARSLQTALAIVEADSTSPSLNLWGLGIISLGTWFCLVIGTQKLVQLVVTVYSSEPRRDSSWRAALLPWAITLLGLAITGSVVALVDRPWLGSQAGLAQWLGLLGRWALALGNVALGLGLVYRLTPRRWVPGLPLIPGVRVTLGLGLGLLGLRWVIIHWLRGQALAYGLLLTLGLNLVVLYGLILLVPIGAQANLSSLRHRSPSRPWVTPAVAPPPPSFDSFKINRRQ
ncbi:hypothetical protein [Nodosilinea sp. E11]|uniref:hypothetical protein n=1 Tax=Nodosilinea sp. E11 TaxID=3037479 RepID=UPI00293516CA|nr:hypothetical protein [Nodosilinea sp. E11]WOD39108.1 hypothetical protein RRF56_23150 [Nodosilinea sp. E11]